MNTMRAGLLLAALTGLFLTAGYLIGAQQGMLIAFIMALGMNAFAYWNSDKMVLRMYGAKQVDRASAPRFYALVEDLARRANMPMPKVYIMENSQPNAFATGRNPENAAVAATTGLLEILDEREIRGVMAHELAHVKHHDTLVMTITATLAGAIGMLANFAFLFRGGSDNRNPMGAIGTLAVMILAPLTAMMVQFAISRAREYGADAGGAAITGDPLALASALSKLERGARQIPNNDAERNPATAHLFIINPLSGRGADNLFSTHPSTANRVKKLQELAGGADGEDASVAAAWDPEAQVRGARPAARRPGPWG